MQVIRNPSMPFWGHIPDGVQPGLVIHIDGHIPHHADKFSINLVKGQDVGHHASHHSSIALHINPRLNEDYIVLNSRHHKDWQDEDRHHHTHTLHRGSGFNVTIHVDSECYRISVNGQHLCNFNHRMPYNEVGALWVDGNVDIHSIEYRREHSGYTPGYTPAYNPGYTPAQTTGYTPGYTPGHTPGYVPGHTAGYTPGYTPGHVPAQPVNTFVPGHFEPTGQHNRGSHHHGGHHDSHQHHGGGY